MTRVGLKQQARLGRISTPMRAKMREHFLPGRRRVFAHRRGRYV